MKKTIGNNWAHIFCVMLTPGVFFGDLDAMEQVQFGQLFSLAHVNGVRVLFDQSGY
jgi:hypothetical protein